MDAAKLLLNCLLYSYTHHFASASGALLLGFALACAGIFGAGCVARGINRSYHRSATFYCMCLLMAWTAWTLVPCMTAVGYLEEVAGVSIGIWQKTAAQDPAWQSAVFAKAYEDVKGLGLEDFRNAPPPEAGGNLIPLTMPASVEAFANRYARETAAYWKATQPLLSRLLWSYQAPSREAVAGEVAEYLAGRHGSYPAGRAIDLAVSKVQESLRRQAPQLVTACRGLLALLALLAECLFLCVIGWSAHKGVKPVLAG